jgi:hypothetical protein
VRRHEWSSTSRTVVAFLGLACTYAERGEREAEFSGAQDEGTLASYSIVSFNVRGLQVRRGR